jgi:leucyl aminopeptidase (aminopeptidase T)
MASRPECVGALRALAVACAGVRAGERCLIVTDSGASAEIVRALEHVLETLGAQVATIRAHPVELPGDSPPEAVGRAMLGAEVVFELTSVFAGASQARREACAAGVRYLTVPGLTWKTLRPGGPFAVDFEALGAAARGLAERIDAASEFRLVGAAGTDLRGSFAGRRGRPLWGVADAPGGYAAPPDVEVGASPVEGTAEGTVVIDGSVLFLGPARLAAPIELSVAGGRVERISGPEAWRLVDALERSGDHERMTNVAEVSIGLNPRARPGGSPLELEGIVGSAHVALGNNIPYGGSVDARAHIDCVILEATLVLDGAPIGREELPSISAR